MKLFFLTLFIIIFSLIDPINMYGNENPRIKSELETKYQYCNHKGRVTYLDKIDCYEVCKSTDDIFKSLIGLCDNEGNEIIPPKYDLIYTYYLEDYKFCKVKVDEHNGIYSLSKKKEIVPPIFDEITLDHKEAYDGELKEYPKFYVKKNDKWGLYCSLLGELVPVAYDKVDHYDTSYCKVSNDERTSIFDLISKEEVVPLKYDNVSLLTGNLVKYSIDNKWGLFSIDKQKELTEAKYDYISTFFNVNGYLTCETNNKKGILNNLGTEIIPPSYSEINIFGDSIAIVIDSLEMDKKHNITKNGKWGAFNLKDNKLIISPQYDFISGNTISENIILCNTGGQAVDLYNVSGGKWGGIDTDGNIVIPFKYESISSFKNGVAQVVIDGAVGLLKNPISDSNLIIESNIHSSIDKDIPIVNKINDETFAFIIANEDYPHIDASYSKRDGNSFAEYCERRLGIPKKYIII